MAKLQRKKISVRAKSGRVYQRSALVRSEQPSLLRRHGATAFVSGFGVGTAAGIGAYAGNRLGERYGERMAAKTYAQNYARGARYADAMHGVRVATDRQWGQTVGTISGMAAGMVATGRSRRVKNMEADLQQHVKAKRSILSALGLMGVNMAGRAAGFVGGAFGAALAHHEYNKRRR